MQRAQFGDMETGKMPRTTKLRSALVSATLMFRLCLRQERPRVTPAAAISLAQARFIGKGWPTPASTTINEPLLSPAFADEVGVVTFTWGAEPGMSAVGVVLGDGLVPRPARDAQVLAGVERSGGSDLVDRD
jgi:hypothetical protein